MSGHNGNGHVTAGRNGTGRNGTADGGLPARQEQVALHLASGRTIVEAARRTKTGVSTVKHWLAEQPAFRERIARLRAELTGQALGRLTDAMSSAADCLRQLLRAKQEAVRLGAARAIIELGAKLREQVELEERLAALESARFRGQQR